MSVDIFMQVLSYLAALGIAIYCVPLLISVLKTKQTSGINLLMFLIVTTSAILFSITGFYSAFSKGVDSETLKSSGTQFGIAVSIANVISALISSITLIIKFNNIFKAKKLKISEKEYEEMKLKQKIENKKSL